MMKRLCTTISLVLGMLASLPAVADDWYQVELLIVEQPPAAATAGDEAWPPFPELDYPADGRFLIDPRRLQERLRDYPRALASSIDERGRQILQLPPLRARRQPPADAPLAPDIPRTSETPTAVGDAVDTGAELPAPADTPGPGEAPLTGGETSDDEASPEAPPEPPTAFVQLPESGHEFRGKAAYMARQGNYRILYHERWWQPVAGPDKALPIVLDDSGDGGAWPKLQGSITLSRSRYLHLGTRLWLNTDGQGLPDTWRMPAPPRGPGSLVLEQADTRSLTWLLRPGILPERADRALFPRPVESAEPPAWPWAHAITVEQTRRMRSGEVHYLDHPRLGIVIKLTRLDQETLEAADYDQAWRHLLTGEPLIDSQAPSVMPPRTTAPTTTP